MVPKPTIGEPRGKQPSTAGGRVVLRAKLRSLDNLVRQIKSHLWVHVAAGLITLVMVLVGGGLFFHMLFMFLINPDMDPFGKALLEKLVGVVLLAFFSMLVFSNLIITLTTTYISRETEFLMGYPLRFRTLFGIKLTESIVYSSWAFALLSFPLFGAYGLTKKAPIGFYFSSLAMSIPFLVIPAALGAMITMFLSAFFPARRARSYTFGLLLAAGLIMVALAKLMGLKSILVSTTVQDISQIMSLLRTANLPLLPNAWFAEGMKAASEGEWTNAGYWFLCLFSTAMFGVQLCLWLVPWLYYRGWSLAKEGAGGGEESRSKAGWSPFKSIDKLFAGFSRPIQALVGKDVRTFWRDPSQWSQLVVLFGPLVFYIANIKGITHNTQNLKAFFHHWPTVVSFFNIGATCFVLSILTTRFIYPLLSLEGKQYWVVGLAPFAKQKLVWEKWWLCAGVCVTVGVTLILFSNAMLEVRGSIAVLGMITATVLALGLTSLAVGLGAVFPDFKQDNPARIANGLGGTLNILASLGYIAATLAIELPAAMHMIAIIESLGPAGQSFRTALSPVFAAIWPFFAAWALLNLIVIVVPMLFGVKRWVRLEFHL